VIEDLDLQRVWMALARRPWRTVAVVSTARDVGTLELANVIAELCWTCRGERTFALDMRATNLRLLDHHRKHIEEHVARGECVVLALPSLDENPITVSMARACDAAVLVVALGTTGVASSKRAIEDIGRERFAGAVLAQAGPKPTVVRLVPHEASRATVRIPLSGAKT
jgi:hypothetical protein